MSTLLGILDRRITRLQEGINCATINEEVLIVVSLRTALESLREVRAELAAELEKAPAVTGYIHADGYILMDAPGNDPSKPAVSNGVEYSARLIDIQEIKSDK